MYAVKYNKNKSLIFMESVDEGLQLQSIYIVKFSWTSQLCYFRFRIIKRIF